MRHRILATDAQERSVLAAIRCLDAAGYEVTAVATTRLAPGLWSRVAAGRRLAPDPTRDVHGFVEKLAYLVRGTRYSVLLAGTDASLLAVSRYRDRLDPYVRVGLPSHEIVERALDKACLAEAATGVGLAPPEARNCGDPDEALAAAAEFGYPVVVKPTHTAVEHNGAIQRWGSVLAANESAVSAAAGSFGSCIVQRRVNGGVLSFAGVATDPGRLTFVLSRYIRTWPRQAGNVCFSETVAPPPGLAEKVELLLANLGWTGVFELELIERGRGDFAAIDFNPRVYGSLSLAVAAGAPLPALWCDWLLGQGVTRSRIRLGARYRWEDADFGHVLSRLHDRRLIAALAVARPRRGVAHAYFRPLDPGPTFGRAAQLIQQRLLPDERFRRSVVASTQDRASGLGSTIPRQPWSTSCSQRQSLR